MVTKETLCKNVMAGWSQGNKDVYISSIKRNRDSQLVGNSTSSHNAEAKP